MAIGANGWVYAATRRFQHGPAAVNGRSSLLCRLHPMAGFPNSLDTGHPALTILIQVPLASSPGLLRIGWVTFTSPSLGTGPPY